MFEFLIIHVTLTGPARLLHPLAPKNPPMAAPATILGLVFALQTIGCTASGHNPASVPPSDSVVVAQHAPVPSEPVQEPVTPAAATSGETRPEPRPETRIEAPIKAQPAVTAPDPGVTAPVSTPPPKADTARTVPSTSATPAKAVSSPAPTGPARKPPAAVATRTEAPALPPLALTTLEQRLKDTNAIGVFTKLALKNQVDDIMGQIRAHHEGHGKSTLAQLRQTYDQLLLKVHDLLKNGDPPLASAIMNSSDAIWAALTDPVKFAKL